MSGQPLRGGCACGRNQYAVLIPNNAAQRAEVLFDSSRDHRKCIFSSWEGEVRSNWDGRPLSRRSSDSLAPGTSHVVSIPDLRLLSRRDTCHHQTNLYASTCASHAAQFLRILRYTLDVLDRVASGRSGLHVGDIRESLRRRPAVTGGSRCIACRCSRGDSRGDPTQYNCCVTGHHSQCHSDDLVHLCGGAKVRLFCEALSTRHDRRHPLV